MTEARSRLAPTVCRADSTRWRDYRGVRLAMLLDEPTAFGSTFAREVGFSDQQWLERIATSTVLLAYEGSLPVGSVTLWQAPDQPSDERYLVGMWVAAHARGTGAGDALVQALLDEAAALRVRRVLLHVGETNARAAALYRRMGFTPTGGQLVLEHQPDVTELELERLL